LFGRPVTAAVYNRSHRCKTFCWTIIIIDKNRKRIIVLWFSQNNTYILYFNISFSPPHCVGVHLFALWPEYQINDNNILFVIILWLDLGIKSFELNALHIPTRNSQKRTVVNNIIIVRSTSSDVNRKVNIKHFDVVPPDTIMFTDLTVLPSALIVYAIVIVLTVLKLKYTLIVFFVKNHLFVTHNECNMK